MNAFFDDIKIRALIIMIVNDTARRPFASAHHSSENIFNEIIISNDGNSFQRSCTLVPKAVYTLWYII